MPQSHHSHSGQFCKHAAGTLEEVVLEAIRQGFDTFGLTEHVPRYRAEDLYPEEEGIPLDALRSQFEDFLVEAHRLKTKYAAQITLLVGLETEFITSTDMDRLETALQAWGDRIEYLVGSVHHVNAIPIDFDRETFTKALHSFAPTPETDAHTTMESFLNSYFDAQYELMRRFRPEVIGHFDLCRLYNPMLRFADYPGALERIRRNVHFAVEYGALFELNAAAFRKGWDGAYPGEDVVEVSHLIIILQAGGRFALSDDSHGLHAVGLNYHRIPEYARRVGIRELWALERSGTMNAAGRAVGPRRVSGNWEEHPFWRGAKERAGVL
ncbi:polymerase/histidinol phosphatase-like protein [Trametes maxima]|nr:polymerase/histidinol phosphatase-like protein [Trametes maxima]